MGEADASKELKSQAQTMDKDKRSEVFGTTMLLMWIIVQLNPRKASHPSSYQTILMILK
ncbi:hypothetical protein RYX36_023572, partial [Vicia faba]